MDKNKIFNRTSIGQIVSYLIVGLLVLLATIFNLYEDYIVNALIIFLSCIPHIFIYIKTKLNGKPKNGFLVIGILGLVSGSLLSCSNTLSLENLCLYWGILDIMRSGYEFFDSYGEFKEDRLDIIEIFVAIGDVFFGLLLCIHLTEGLFIHLIYFVIAYFISAIKNIIWYATKGKKR